VTRPVAWPQGHDDSQIQFKWVSIVALCTAVGLGSVAIADVASRQGADYAVTSVFFWVGLLLIFAPIAFRILSNNVHPREQLALVVLLGIALYVAKLLGSPDAFTGTDEYVHLRNTQDILRTQHVFNSNPLLPTAAFYPGLGAATAGLADLTGLSPFVSGVLIIGAQIEVHAVLNRLRLGDAEKEEVRAVAARLQPPLAIVGPVHGQLQRLAPELRHALRVSAVDSDVLQAKRHVRRRYLRRDSPCRL